MKKILSVALACVLSLALLGMAAQAEQAEQATDVIGEWYLNAIEMNGASMNPAAMGMEMSITINEDGSALLVATGEADTPASWTLEDDVLTLTQETSASPMALTLTDEGLTVEQSGMKMIFSQEKAEVEAVEIAPIRIAEDIAEFDGEWVATMVDAGGVQMPMEMTGAEMRLTIENGAVKASMSAPGQESADATEMQGELKDGALVVTAPAGAEAGEQVINLHEDGMLSLAADDQGVVYLEKVAAE